MSESTDHPAPPVFDKSDLGQIVLVLQGGGALGAYQAGVYQALDEAGIEPDWVIGTSIGAINAGIIAGNKRENRLPRLQEFWSRMRHGALTEMAAAVPWWGSQAASAMTASTKARRQPFQPKRHNTPNSKIPKNRTNDFRACCRR